MPMFLVPLEGGDAISLEKAVTFIGRHPDCDIVLSNSRKVSRKHCCIAQINEAYVVRDLGSMNGVRVNDDVSHDEMRLRPGMNCGSVTSATGWSSARPLPRGRRKTSGRIPETVRPPAAACVTPRSIDGSFRRTCRLRSRRKGPI